MLIEQIVDYAEDSPGSPSSETLVVICTVG